jgi:Flp pilus assembly protein TadG
MNDHPRVARERGSAFVELAVTLPVLVALLVGSIDFARVFFTAMAVTTAVRAAAQYGARDTTLATADMEATANTMWQGEFGNTTGFTVSASRSCGCAPDAPTTVDYTLDAPSPNDCTGSCSTGHKVNLVTVTASKTFTTLTRFPGIPKTIPISRTVVMRGE